MTRNETPSQIFNGIAARTVGGLLLIPGVPLAIVGMLAFNMADGIWKWFVGRKA